ncbi:glycosyltransferase family 4 protein [Vicingus serpentipes]|uniref:Glycosyltransferase family 4 protein n=1 Tax=Vicingus serpentipes TaxID=1926625 RepID=A0A5C6RTT4_9FLAO|nr:glycosyltransferase family 1 protein [Vicingus serpentipes]TXB65384.1 glycosyltransferase family 4 protein [Vicingus serpentipes]
MKVAVNTRLLLKNKIDGIGLVTYESFKRIVLTHPQVTFYFIFDRPPHSDYIFADNIEPVILKPQARHPLLYIVWYQFSLKRWLKKVKPDIFIGTDGMIPLNSETKTLAIIHDLNFEHHPEQLPKAYRNYYRKYFPLFAKKSTRIAAVSEFTKQDIVKTYQIKPSKIDVVYNGVNKEFKPLNEIEKETIKAKYSEANDFFLFIGSLHPRKNLVRLFEAFNQFKQKNNSDLKLLIVGKKMWWPKEIEEHFNQLEYKNDIIFSGRVERKDLYKITASAYALTYVPIFEGFGIPLVEAMKSGVPVITSNVTSMPEVVQDAGILVNPFSVDDIANAMTRIVTDKKLHAKLAQKSLIQGEKFNWDKTGDELWESILKTIDA